MTNGVSLIAMNIHFLEQGLTLLNDIGDDLFTNTDSDLYKSSVAKHLRHVLEHYQSLLESEDGNVDYDDRQRNDRLENDRNYAIETIRTIIESLKSIEFHLKKPVKIKNNEDNGAQSDPWGTSSYQRELQFLISHTVHHYALIAIILRIQGYLPEEDFGVAPSTLRYQKQVQNKATG